MKLLISKIEENGKTQLSVKFSGLKGEEEFDYVKMIEHLYHNPHIEIELTFSESILDEERQKIKELFNDIKTEAQKEKKDTTLETDISDKIN